MKFLDLDGLKQVLKKLVSYNSRNGIAVKRIEGKPEPGKFNSTLVLGSGIQDVNFYSPTNGIYSWMEPIRANGKSSILIGKKDINALDSDPNNKGISLISNDNISLYAYSHFNLKASSDIGIMGPGAINVTATRSNIKMNAYDYIQFTGNTQEPNNKSTILIDDTIKMNTSRIHIREGDTDDDVSFFKTGTVKEISIGGTVKTGPAIKIEGGETPFNIKFRLGSDVTARLTNNNIERGFYIFTNLYAKTDNSTDLPAKITSTVKEALDTKSVQCLLAELLMKTGLY